MQEYGLTLAKFTFFLNDVDKTLLQTNINVTAKKNIVRFTITINHVCRGKLRLKFTTQIDNLPHNLSLSEVWM